MRKCFHFLYIFGENFARFYFKFKRPAEYSDDQRRCLPQNTSVLTFFI